MDLRKSIQSTFGTFMSKASNTGDAGAQEMTEPTQKETTAASSTTSQDDRMPTEAEVRNALKSVYDPEIGISVEDLGLIYGVRHEGRNVVIDMTLTTPACPLGPVIKTQAHAVLTAAFPQVDDVDINLVWTPRWDPRTMASEEAKAELGIW
jgi:metal-sulfur cluster biosynthetic enzyme